LAHIALGALSADLAASRRELSDRGAAGRDIDGMGSFADADGDTDDCAVLQLPLHAAAASGSPPGALPGRGPSGGGHAAGRGGNLSLLDAGEAQRRSVLALQGLARLREEQGRVRAALESERGENGRVEAEVAERLKEAALLEQELLTKQAVVGRGPMAFVPGFLHGKLATVAAVVAGVVIFLAIMCFVMRYSTANSQVRAKRLTAREGEEAECGLTRSEPVIGDSALLWFLRRPAFRIAVGHQAGRRRRRRQRRRRGFELHDVFESLSGLRVRLLSPDDDGVLQCVGGLEPWLGGDVEIEHLAALLAEHGRHCHLRLRLIGLGCALAC